MLTLEVRASEFIGVSDFFGTVAVAVKRWASSFFVEVTDEEVDEPHETDDSPESGTDPPTLGISVEETINTNDTFGK